jgi:multimeric flavodoxin WrbA
MHILILHSSPNNDGLTAACAEAAAKGAREAGASVESVCINELNIQQCQACERGWGDCLEQHRCQTLDDFQALHERILQADGLVLVTPVYWGEMSESAKALTDRLRRCEATHRKESRLLGKPLVAVAAAGGSGGGMITCLASMERWAQHTGARVFDLLPVNRWSREYKLVTIQSATYSMVQTEISTKKRP